MTNGFKTKEINLPSLGERLKKVREEQGISLERASKATKIQMKYLNFLENGKYEKLPADVYAKSFLKSYASFLKINSEDAEALFKKEKKIGEKLKGVFFKNKKRRRYISSPAGSYKKKNDKFQNKPGCNAVSAAGKFRMANLVHKKEKNEFSFDKIPLFAITPKVLIFGLSVIIIAAISIYFFYQLSFLMKPPELIVEYPKEDLIVQEEKILVKGKTQINAEISINGSGAWLDEEGVFNQELFLQEGINIIKIIAVNKFGRKNEVIRKIIYEL
jgi:transcriptional regulator with XRE-family HTH domain